MKFLKRWKAQILCVAAGFLLYFLAVRYAPAGTDLSGGNTLPRDSYGGGTEHYAVVVEGLTGKPETVDIPVSPRIYRPEELSAAFDACMEELTGTLAGYGGSLSEVRTDLRLPTHVDSYGIRVSWTSSAPDVLTSWGEVKNEALEGPAEVVLTAHLSSPGSQGTADFAVPVTVLPPAADEETAILKRFLSDLGELDRSQAAEAEFRLPADFEGKTLRYSQERRENYAVLPLLGIVSAALLYLRSMKEVRDTEKERRKQMLLDYPEIVSKFMIFIGAGMTIRLAWEYIVADYESSGGPVHYAYEEMSRSLMQLKTGAGEGRAYHEFGRNCGLRQYMKLAGIFEQNRKTGIANIRSILSVEMNQAWEERKNLARRMGEEAGTRLLAPLFLMLLVVMAMIVVPAVLAF